MFDVSKVKPQHSGKFTLVGFSGVRPQVILLILSPCLIAFAQVFFYINLFVYCRTVNAAVRNVNVLPSNLCLVLVNVDIVLMGG